MWESNVGMDLPDSQHVPQCSTESAATLSRPVVGGDDHPKSCVVILPEQLLEQCLLIRVKVSSGDGVGSPLVEVESRSAELLARFSYTSFTFQISHLLRPFSRVDNSAFNCCLFIRSRKIRSLEKFG